MQFNRGRKQLVYVSSDLRPFFPKALKKIMYLAGLLTFPFSGGLPIRLRRTVAEYFPENNKGSQQRVLCRNSGLAGHLLPS